MTLEETQEVLNCLRIAWDYSPYYTSGTSTFECTNLQTTVEESELSNPFESDPIEWSKIFGLYMLPVYLTIILVPTIVFSVKIARKRRTQDREGKDI